MATSQYTHNGTIYAMEEPSLRFTSPARRSTRAVVSKTEKEPVAQRRGTKLAPATKDAEEATAMIEDDSEPFSVMVSADETVENLKKRIKSEGPPELNDFHPRDLKLWQVDKPDDQKMDSSGLTNENALKPTQRINRYWEKQPDIGF